MALTRIERNQIFEALAASNLDPAECNLSEKDQIATILHRDSGSTFEFHRVRLVKGYQVLYDVVDGRNFTYQTRRTLENLTPNIIEWANEVKLITDAPDLWAEMKRSRGLITEIQQADSDNTLFTEDEQRQIAAQLEAIKQQVREQREQFGLTNEQVEQIYACLDGTEEASKRIGRKDWLLLFGGTVLNLIVTDTITPGVAGHIFTAVVQGIVHLFGGGPPQILS